MHNTEELIRISEILKSAAWLIGILFSAIFGLLLYVWNQHKKEIQTDRALTTEFHKEIRVFVTETVKIQSRHESELLTLSKNQNDLGKETSRHALIIAQNTSKIDNLLNNRK